MCCNLMLQVLTESFEVLQKNLNQIKIERLVFREENKDFTFSKIAQPDQLGMKKYLNIKWHT